MKKWVVLLLSLSNLGTNAKVEWQENSFDFPDNAMVVGYSRQDNKNLYACRTNLWGSTQLGYTWRKHKKCYIPYGRRTYLVDKFGVLTEVKGQWQPYYGYFPQNAWVFGYGVNKRPLVLCRGYYRNNLLPGKVWPGHQHCEVVFKNRNKSLRRFSVYVKEAKQPS